MVSALCNDTGPSLNIKTIFPGYRDYNVKDKMSQDCLIFNMGIPILVRQHLYIKTAPWIQNFIKVPISVVIAFLSCNQICPVTPCMKWRARVASPHVYNLNIPGNCFMYFYTFVSYDSKNVDLHNYFTTNIMSVVKCLCKFMF